MLTVFPVFAVFLYAILGSPGPSRGFWKLEVSYLVCKIMVKLMFQLHAFCISSDGNITLRPDPRCTTDNVASNEHASDASFLGLHKAATGAALLGYIMLDLIGLIFIAVHRHVVFNTGLWTRKETEIVAEMRAQHIEKRQDRQHRKQEGDDEKKGGGARDQAQVRTDNDNAGNERKEKIQMMKHGDEEDDDDFLANLSRKIVSILPDGLGKYYKGLLTTEEGGRTIKTGYSLNAQFALELSCGVYILFFFSQMAAPTAAGLSASLSSNRFSGEMVLFFLAQIVFILVDRVAALRRSIFLKLVHFYASIGFWIPLVIFSWPQKSCTAYSRNPTAAGFLALKMAYLMISGYQIRFGYPDKIGIESNSRSHKKKGLKSSSSSSFPEAIEAKDEGSSDRKKNLGEGSSNQKKNLSDMKHSQKPGSENPPPTSKGTPSARRALSKTRGKEEYEEQQLMYPASRIGLYLFRIYRGVPFVFEIKTLLDWTVTKTVRISIRRSLDAWEAFTLEDIYANMYIVQCDLIYYRGFRRGQKTELVPKSRGPWFALILVIHYLQFTQGVLLLLVLLLILFGPLLLFSTANPVTENNNVHTAVLSISILSANGGFKLVQISNTKYGFLFMLPPFVSFAVCVTWDKFNKSFAVLEQLNLSTIDDDLSPYASPRRVVGDEDHRRFIRVAPLDLYNHLRESQVIDTDDACNTVQEIHFSEFADNVFSLTPPVVADLTATLKDPKQMTSIALEVTFERPGPPENKEIHYSSVKILTQSEQAKLASLLETNTNILATSNSSDADSLAQQNGTANSGVYISSVVPTLMRLPATGGAKELVSTRLGIYLDLKKPSHGMYGGGGTIYWRVGGEGHETAFGGSFEDRSNEPASAPARGIGIVSVSNEVFPASLALSGYSVIGIYITVIVTIGNLNFLLKFVASNYRSNVPRSNDVKKYKHLQDATVLLKYCESVFIARSTGQLELEEELFRQLTKILRTPRLLIELAKRKDKKIS
eukprot:jgi/Bigna1/78536/fgenesh1_pg.55_\